MQREPRRYEILALNEIAIKTMDGTGFTKVDLKSRRRDRALCRVRDEFILRARNVEIPTTAIGAYLNRDHSTIIDAEQRQKDRMRGGQ